MADSKVTCPGCGSDEVEVFIDRDVRPDCGGKSEISELEHARCIKCGGAWDVRTTENLGAVASLPDDH